MVSLSRSINTNSGGATFFSESVNMEDRQHLQPILDSYGIFKPVKTIKFVAPHLIFTLILNILAIFYAIKHPDLNSKCKEYFTIIYLHIGLWFLTLIVDQVLKINHHILRMNGYFEFFHKLECHGRIPFYIVSLWSIALMFVQNLMQHFYPDNFFEKCLSNGALSPLSYICALITCEFLVLAGININYIVKVYKFNKQQPPPDVQKEDWTACASPENFGQNEIGYRQLGDNVCDFLEKQADLIRYLKEHNVRLADKLMIVSTQAQLLRERNARAQP